MLYATTRNDAETYTAQRALRENRGPDGGLYVPFRSPHIPPEAIAGLGEKPFGQNVAEMLNLLFGTRLTGADVDFAIGRRSVRVKRLGNRVLMGECWHNLDGSFSRMATDLAALLRGEAGTAPSVGDWAETGIRIGVIFGLFGELMGQGIAGPDRKIDISLVSGNFSAPMSAWYARQWGLPIGNIVCCCNENGNLWDFLCHGQLRTDGVAVVTNTPEADVVVPTGLERLIYAVGGSPETERYLEALRRGGSYYMEESLLRQLNRGLYAAVTSRRRVRETIPKVYGTHSRVLSPYSALAYAGLQDYRSRTGESRMALVLTEKSPSCDLETVAAALAVTPEELKNHLNRN